ncbi:MAG TPA: ThuA domain-containing protein [Pirellulales bacterium]|jgi:chitinase|nr:ThuA domain-containing protein [Pirellulales bacterium]
MRRTIYKAIVTALLVVISIRVEIAQELPANTPRSIFRVLALTSRAKDHLEMIAAATPMLQKLAAENNFSVDVTDDPTVLNDENLARYQAFVQLQEAPFDMSPDQQLSLQKYIEQGHGWVGIHAAGLTGKKFLAPNISYWQWFEDFLGGITYSPHPKFQKGTLVIEDHSHPVTKNLPAQMQISDEWYEFNESPRPRVHVLATADESTYKQNKPMGDHPMIWINEKYRRMVYIAIGHSASLCDNPDFRSLIRDAILWAASDQ